MSQYHPYRPGQSSVEPSARDAPSFEHPAWDSRQSGYQHQPQQFQPQPRLESRPEVPPPRYWDEDGSDSDVSRTFDPREPVNRILSPVAAPRQLPRVSSPRILNSLDEVQARRTELGRIDDHNTQKLKTLREKRNRKDERISRRRAEEDDKIRIALEARARKDERIRVRRHREDDGFAKADDQLAKEGLELDRRQRNLKRGLPTEDARSTSVASMSPPMPLYQAEAGPPPPKRHQSGPPGQNDSPGSAQVRLTQHSPALSQYHYYQPSSNSHFQHQYHYGPPVSQTPYQATPAILPSSASASSPRPGNTPLDAGKMNGFNTPPPAPAPPPAGSIDTRPPVAINAPTYDTRPPPPTAGFTSVNAGQTSGFATVNARVPSHATTTPSKLVKEHGTPKSEGPQRGSGKSPKSTTPITVGGLPLNKRTPSTTHPYQMSEAFANRHHHCEREDELKRGIWTSYGPMDDRDVPTGPSVEMYLRCNHDACKRIDWKTVHGLQCHIVKNHEQPKGTIGSLERALAIYGVPVSEIQEYESVHGLGSAGQMADPKNQKIKNKTKEAMQKSQSPGSADASTPSVTPSASYTSNGTALGGPMFPHTPSRVPDAMSGRPTTDRGSLGNETQAKPDNDSFKVVRSNWLPYEPQQTTSPKDRGAFGKPPMEVSVSTSDVPMPISIAPIETSEKVLPLANAVSVMDPATAAVMEISRAEPKTEPPTAAPAAQTMLPLTAAFESTSATSVTSSEPPAQVSKEDPVMHSEQKAGTATQPQPEVPPQPEEQPQANKEKETTLSEPKILSELMTLEAELSTQTITGPESAPQPPTTPARRPSRRESVSLSKSAQKDAAAAVMPSPKMNKADAGGKRAGAGRRPSAAISAASMSANASGDGSGDEGEQKTDSGAKRAGMSTGPRRTAAGRYLRKGR